MFKNYLKIAWRIIIRNKLFSAINILGLVIGFTAVILIYAWIQQELRYDNFHERKDQIYRVTHTGANGNGVGTPAPFAPTISEEIPSIIAATRLRIFPKVVFKVDEFFDDESQGYGVDSSFFNIFSFPLLAGNQDKIFQDPFSVVITKSLAKKYFGNKNPIGENILVENLLTFNVSGIIEDVPLTSHLQFDYLFSTKMIEAIQMCGMQWGDFNFKTYVLLTENADLDNVKKQMNEIAIKNNCPQIKQQGRRFGLQSLDETYLNPINNWDLPTLGNRNSVIIFSLIGVLIIIIASFNYINLSTAKSENRIKEVGIRKVVGANKKQIILQFIGESFLLAVIAINFAIIICYRLFPFLNRVVDKPIEFEFTSIPNISFILLILVSLGIFAGIYPAILMSITKPHYAAKNYKRLIKSHKKHGKSNLFRKVLVVSQFTIAIALIISTTFIFRQLKYIQTTSWNLEQDVVLHFTVREEIGNKYNLIKERLLQMPSIKSVTIKDELPTVINNNTTGVWWERKDDSFKGVHFETIRVGYDYFKTMDIPFINGRDFSQDHPADSLTGFILNEKALQQTGIENPIGKVLGLYSQKGQIIGIVKNTLFQSAKEEYKAQVYYFLTSPPNNGYMGSVLVRIDGRTGHKGISEIIDKIEGIWYDYNKSTPFEYGLLNDTIYRQYKNESRLSKLILYFAAVAIFISTLGMLGLTYFMIENKTKEIGIRKVNGASPSSINKLIISDFVKNIIIASALAWPISYYFIDQWLNNFAFRTPFNAYPFITATAIAFIIAISTIWILVVKAANRNPAESLKYE